MKMECLYLFVSMTIYCISVTADSSEEMVAMYRDGKPANMRAFRKNSISNEDIQTVYYFKRQRHCTRIRNVCASNGIIYEDYCKFKAARSFEDISRVTCTEGHAKTFSYSPPRVPAIVTNQPRTTKRFRSKTRIQAEGENGRIDNRVNVVTEPIPPVQLQTTKESCAEVCPLTYEPLCATDGKGYPSPCVFEASKCTGNTDQSVEISYYGLCESPEPPTDNLEGFRYCPEDECEEDISYVCGTDENTYENKCKLLKVACTSDNSTLDIEYEGPCTTVNITVTPEPNGTEPLPTPKKSQMTTEDSCANPTCKLLFEPVCANDGKTYPSACVLENINRCDNLKLSILHEGACVKPTKCTITCPPLELEPVCGTDNNSYPSRCNLLKYNCENEVEIEVDYDGECIPRGDI